ncbi:MAG: tRNA pseudouridine(55) synthase TruB [Lachnospiraceae bacterium]|nr:tRNA pseudouridine(55) synthase TruB [Lachnospiraceae bacterium]
MDGIINIYKEKGYTSFDVVAKLRGILKTKKIGHTGTLDPDAEGVLPVCVGRATRVCDLLTDRDKTYRAVMRLGVTTDTLDMTGNVLKTSDVNLSVSDIKNVVEEFIGNISQIPPMYSAIKVDGQRLYDLARKGVEVERKPRQVTIHAIEIIDIDLPLVTFEVDCSKGTYIRTLCNDIGEKLGCGGAMESLIRLKAAGFEIKDAMTLEEVEKKRDDGTLEKEIMSIDQALLDYPAIYCIPDADRFLKNGNRLNLDEIISESESIFNGRLRAYFSDASFAGIYEYEEESKEFKAVKLFI